jgi:integrase
MLTAVTQIGETMPACPGKPARRALLSFPKRNLSPLRRACLSLGLTVDENIGRALTYEEKVKLLHRAGTRPEWQTVACAARLALNTTMRGCEIKEMRWRDVDMIGRSLTVRKSKTEAGERVIPLNADAWAVILELYRRSQALGATEPSHFLFPSCETAHFDPSRGIKSWRTAWRRLTRAVQCAGCGLLPIPARRVRVAG